jgi:hypothetical protein
MWRRIFWLDITNVSENPAGPTFCTMKMEAVGTSETTILHFNRIHGVLAKKIVILTIRVLKARNKIWSGNVARMQKMRTAYI